MAQKQGTSKRDRGTAAVVKIKKLRREAGDAKESQSIYCEALYADNLFVRRYKRYCDENQSSDQVTSRATDLPRDSATTAPQEEGCQASEFPGNNSKSEEAGRQIFISAWYRYLLGIPKRKESKTDPHRFLEITMPKNSWQALCWQFLACVKHPHIVVALGTILGLIGFFLGVGWIRLRPHGSEGPCTLGAVHTPHRFLSTYGEADRLHR